MAIEYYVSLLQNKFDKYKDKMNEFDDFIVLCDALHTIEVTSDEDAMNIVDQFKAINSDLPHFRVVILWLDDVMKASTFIL